MSLETKIEKLTAAIEALTAQVTTIQMLNNLEARPITEIKPITVNDLPTPETETVVVAEKKAKTEQVEKPKKEKVDTGITAESLRDLCMSIVRADRSKKAAIKDLMADKFGAKVVDDIDTKNFAEFKQLLEAL